MSSDVEGQLFLVAPMQPTPNGRMHIGHGGGTYLRADAISRSLRVRGARVVMISGTDAYENWVIAEARRIDRTTAETCSFYHHVIAEDLGKLGIHWDAWIDPLGPEHHDSYVELHERIFTALRSGGAARREKEQLPFVASTGSAIVGVFLAGQCPRCGADAQGSSCVLCGAHFQPGELDSPRSRLDDEPIMWREEENWFIRPIDEQAVLTGITTSPVSPDVSAAARQYLEFSGGRIRLSGPRGWGIQSAAPGPGSVLSNPYYLYSVYCGEVARTQLGVQVNPFEPESAVQTIGVFGNDNTVPGVIAPQVISQGAPHLLTPFGHVVVNGMLNFEGRKCSTSKRHGIWLGELLDNTTITSDELRWVLANQPLDDGPADLSLADVVQGVSWLRSWAHDLDDAIAPWAGQELAWSEELEQIWESAPADLESGLTVHALAQHLRQMMAVPVTAPDRLLLLSVQLEPLLPDTSGSIWRQLGLPGRPTIGAARGMRGQLASPARSAATPAIGHGALTVADISPYVHLGG